MLRLSTAFLLTAAALPAGRAAAQPVTPGERPRAPVAGVSGTCAERSDAGAARTFGRSRADLSCVELLPTPTGGAARGMVELGWVPGPFGVAVDAEGVQVHRLTAWIEGLPDPKSVGPYARFVAWAAPPHLGGMVRLGPVDNGRNDLGTVALEAFLVLVTAEETAEVAERHGPLVLRGRSPATRLEPHELLAQAPAALRAPAEPEGAGGAEEAGGAPREAPAEAGAHPARPTGAAWPMPPMYPDVPNLPGLRDLEPATAPWRLEAERPERLPEARPARLVELPDGGTLDLEAGLVRRSLAGRDLVMLAFNGQHPGPLIRVPRDATIFVNFINSGPLPSSVHWHGVRLENPFDGVPGVTQEPVAPGETFRYRVRFPDAGVYWYHPHHREDIQQELGLYGNLLVEPPPAHAYGPAHREEALILDDLLLDERGIVPFGEARANYALMGRFGNLLLVNGEPRWSAEVGRGAVVRLHLTNAASTRTFNLSFVPEDGGRPPRIKAVGSDVGKLEREAWVESVVLGPAERATVEARFERAGRYTLANRVRAIDHIRGVFFPEETPLGTVAVRSEPATPDLTAPFEELREHPEVAEEVAPLRARLEGPPDLELELDMEASGVPEVVEQVMRFDWLYFPPVEWAGTMPAMNWATTSGQVRWILRDPATGAENAEIDWRFRVGDRVKIRIRNRRDAFHAMQHPIHIHGQRFVILARDGVPNPNLAWKDTALLPVGSTTDILLELSNPGRWMVHCHIAEHLEAGMQFVLEVDGEGRPGGNRP